MDTRKTKPKWLVLAVLLSGPYMVALDSTSVYLALPVMAKDLSIPQESIQGVMTAYLVAVVATILLFGRLGDMLGKEKIFTLGVAVFGTGSLLAALSHNIWLLCFARVLEGLGAGAAMANNQGIITEVFSEKQRGTALGFSSLFAAIGTALGPIISGVILSHTRWNAIFLVNIPVAVLAFVAALVVLPKTRQAKQQRLDITGAALIALAIVLLFTTLARGDAQGYASWFTPLGFGGSALLITLFVRQEKHNKNPMVELSMFKNLNFTLAIACVLFVFAVRGGEALLMPVFTENYLGIGDEQSGLVLAALPLVMGAFALSSGVLSNKFGPARLTTVGLGAMLCACVGLAFASRATPLWALVSCLGLMGMGSGLFTAPNNSLIMGAVSKDKLGTAGSINGFMRNLGSTVGVSLFSGVLYASMGAKVGYRVTGYDKVDPGAFQAGWRLVFLLAAGFLAFGLLLALKRMAGQNTQKAQS